MSGTNGIFFIWNYDQKTSCEFRQHGLRLQDLIRSCECCSDRCSWTGDQTQHKQNGLCCCHVSRLKAPSRTDKTLMHIHSRNNHYSIIQSLVLTWSSLAISGKLSSSPLLFQESQMKSCQTHEEEQHGDCTQNETASLFCSGNSKSKDSQPWGIHTTRSVSQGFCTSASHINITISAAEGDLRKEIQLSTSSTTKHIPVRRRKAIKTWSTAEDTRSLFVILFFSLWVSIWAWWSLEDHTSTCPQRGHSGSGKRCRPGNVWTNAMWTANTEG